VVVDIVHDAGNCGVVGGGWLLKVDGTNVGSSSSS